MQLPGSRSDPCRAVSRFALPTFLPLVGTARHQFGDKRMNDDAQSAEPKPKQKRPWIKPRVRLVDFAVTRAGPVAPGDSYYKPESTLHPASTPYDPNLS